jgi:hypothetical protein
MKLALAAACLAAASLFASQALADEATKATLEQPLAAKTVLIAAHAAWVCEHDTCVAGATQDGSFGVDECHDLARQVGRIATFQGEYHKPLPAAQMDKCNTGAKSAGAVTAAR